MEKGKVFVTVIDDYTVDFQFKDTPHLEEMIDRKYEPAFFRSKLLFFDNFAGGSYVRSTEHMRECAILRYNSRNVKYMIDAFRELNGRYFTAFVDDRGFLAIDPYERAEE